MAIEPIPTRNLKLADIPTSEADWFVVATFALTHDGPTPDGADSNPVEVPSISRTPSVDDLRARLYLEQRRWRYRGEPPDPESMDYIRKILDEIRRRVEGAARPGDPRD
ncbi:MAG: hypothetical protein AABZ01_08415 [Gemmatimonadota bacterium]